MDVADIHVMRLAIDAGLMVLIWMVQLVVYPSMTYMTKPQIDQWHPIYTGRITVIVMPLMLGQVVVYAISLWLGVPSILTYISVGLIAVTWLVTFLRAVPLHGRMISAADASAVARDLARCNWYRTALWTGVAILSLIEVVYLH